MWISTGSPPMSMPTFTLGIDNQSDVISIEAKIAEKHITLLDKPSGHCKVYNDDKEGFNICSQSFFTTFLKERINCILPGNFFQFLN